MVLMNISYFIICNKTVLIDMKFYKSLGLLFMVNSKTKETGFCCVSQPQGKKNRIQLLQFSTFCQRYDE